MATKKNLCHVLWEASNAQAFGTSLLKDPKWHDLNVAEKDQILSSILPAFDGLRVLEIGGGIGRFTTDFVARAGQVTVVDLSEDALRENQKRHREYVNITYITGSITEVRFDPRSFDLIFSNWLLMYLNYDEIRQLLKNCLSWLTPGGTIFFHESCNWNFDRHGLLRQMFSLEALRSFFPFIGRPFYSIWKFKLPPLKDIWHALRHFEKPVQYREGSFYETCFADDFQIVSAGHLAAYEHYFQNRFQLYWLLAPKTAG